MIRRSSLRANHRTPGTVEARKPLRLAKPPAWLKLGAIVNYSAVIGEPPTILGARVVADPFRMPGSTTSSGKKRDDGNWITFIDKKHGWVAIEALELVT